MLMQTSPASRNPNNRHKLILFANKCAENKYLIGRTRRGGRCGSHLNDNKVYGGANKRGRKGLMLNYGHFVSRGKKAIV